MTVNVIPEIKFESMLRELICSLLFVITYAVNLLMCICACVNSDVIIVIINFESAANL
jgi:hypothetical protein